MSDAVIYMRRTILTAFKFYSTCAVRTMARYKGIKDRAGERKAPLTHFLCLPLVTANSRPQLERSMQEFRDILSVDQSNSTISPERMHRGSDFNKEEVLPGVHPKAIRPVGALHCTLGVMSLDEERLRRAIVLLENLDIIGLLGGDSSGQERSDRSTISSTSTNSKSAGSNSSNRTKSINEQLDLISLNQLTYKPLTIDLKGLMSMHPPRKTSILYSAPQETTAEDPERLFRFCLAVQKLFREQRLLVEDERPLKLHVTIVNTVYTKSRETRSKAQEETLNFLSSAPSFSAQPATPEMDTKIWGHTNEDDVSKNDASRKSGPGRKANAPLKIDATALLERFKNFVFAENVVLDRLAICEMGAKVSDDQRNLGEHYKEVACVKL